MQDLIESEKPVVHCVIGAQCQPTVVAEGLGGSLCNVHAMSSAAL